ncbi:DUF502 domain-containing protein [Salarchaeum japonicum]|uniref:DUF502 domain-containing protein n=1 Tax=Salarchaeum japonicum TaxID=555573 RepID=A0AAV3SYM1_9EURY|nr:DUF502 domain-containing protein [Salarchaeum japonicum]
MSADSMPPPDRVQEAGENAYAKVREAALTGVAVIIPLLITIYVLTAAIGVFEDMLRPVREAMLQADVAPFASTLLIELTAVVLLVAVIFAVGFTASFSYGQKAIAYFDKLVERVPGIGAVYKSFRQMSDVMLESDANNFQEVKLVEYPHEGTYTLGFETTRTPKPLRNAASDDTLRTLFLPLAPNPVMGGFLAHIPEERIMDVDMTVEEGMRAVVTTGVAVAGDDTEGLSQEELSRLTGSDMADALSDDE